MCKQVFVPRTRILKPELILQLQTLQYTSVLHLNVEKNKNLLRDQTVIEDKERQKTGNEQRKYSKEQQTKIYLKKEKRKKGEKRPTWEI